MMDKSIGTVYQIKDGNPWVIIYKEAKKRSPVLSKTFDGNWSHGYVSWDEDMSEKINPYKLSFEDSHIVLKYFFEEWISK